MHNRPPRAALTAVLLMVLQGCGPSFYGRTQLGAETWEGASRLPLSRDLWAPGEKMAASPEETAQRPLCASGQQSGLVVLEDAAVVPTIILPGEQIYHRLRYVVCPAASAHPVTGKIIRTVRMRKVKIFEDITDYVFKPGSWIVDAAIIVPEDAESGEYVFDVAITVGKSRVKRGNTFLVKKR